MADRMAPREPGEPGSMQGVIKTPMCSANVGNEGGGKTHTFKGMPSANGGVSIEGPGADGKWDTQINISGSNKGKY